MEHWQFLIQEQGARSWHILESPNLEISEGQYRVLARSSLPNTDVEVRVTHSSSQQVQPMRRIFKRSRRTNSEGLMPIIPFTNFHAGLWEFRCSGDLMSDLLGQSWQYSIQIKVLSQEEETERRENVESNSPDRLNTISANLDTTPAEAVITDAKAIAVPPELAVTTVLDEVKLDTAVSEIVITDGEAIAVSPELAASTVVDEGKLDTAVSEIVITDGEAIAVSPELVVTTVLDEVKLDTAVSEIVITDGEAIAVSPELAVTTVLDEVKLDTAVSEIVITDGEAIAVSPELAVSTDSNPVNTVVSDETEKDRVIDELVNSAWLKCETAEQILENLVDLTLPSSERLLKDEKVRDFPLTQPPLLLTLEQDNYIAVWGQALTISGQVELEEKTNLDRAETSPTKSLQTLELGIELRSPLDPKIFTQVRQPLPDQELPFSINTSIDIPADFETKLILADITLYGRFTDIDEIIRLASQSFTITADLTELLAITAAVKPSTSLNDPIIPSDSPSAFTEPETAVRIDLRLFNLVTIPKTDESEILNPSANTPQPPRVNLHILRETTLRTSNLKKSVTSLQLPQFPKLPPIEPIETDVSLPPDVIAEPPTQEELLEKDPLILPAINLEQLLIKQRRTPKLNITFPYLRRLQPLPDDAEEVKNNVLPDALEVQAAENLPQLDAIAAEDEKIPELILNDAPSQEESVAEVETQPNAPFQEESVVDIETQPNPASQEESVVGIETQPNAQLITTGNLYSSPLLRKWMESQGYSLPESINELERQNHDRYIPAQQTELFFNAETPNADVDLPLSLDDDTDTTWKETQESVFALDNFEEDADTTKESDLEIEKNAVIEKVSQSTLSMAMARQLPLPPASMEINIASAWLAEEIVVDDAYSDIEVKGNGTNNYLLAEENQPLLGLSSSVAITTGAIEPLPIPQLHLPEGELIAEKFIIVRVTLPEVSPQVVVKLWVEDYQTRWLLDGPHLLTNLLPNELGGVEVITQIKIPFGCLEIRIEAIALDLTTQQESHKVTIVRAVIPPNLPELQLDELLGSY